MIAALPLVLGLLAAQAPVAAKPAAPKVPKSVRWESSFPAALSKAKSTRRPIMVDFWADWCGYCHRLDQTTYRDASVVRVSQEFISVKVNSEGTRDEVGIASSYLVTSLPTILFLSPEGRPFLRLGGYLPPAAFLQAIEEAKRRGATVIEWEAALTKDPQDANALSELGIHQFTQLQQAAGRSQRQLVSRKMLKDVQDLLTRARQLDTSRAPSTRKRVRIALALLHGYRGAYPDAETILKEAINLPASPAEDAKAHLTLGEIYLSQEKQDPAVKEFKITARDYSNTEEGQAAQEYLQRMGVK